MTKKPAVIRLRRRFLTAEAGETFLGLLVVLLAAASYFAGTAQGRISAEAECNSVYHQCP